MEPCRSKLLRPERVDRISSATTCVNGNVRPFIKWPGGKRWLRRKFCELTNGIEYVRYLEPFLGGGAIFFTLSPKSAVLGDVNPELINAYNQTKRDPAQLIAILKEWPVDAETYARLRRSEVREPTVQAARFLYLNRTCFGGMYRVNKEGKFNVPFGGGDRTTRCLWEGQLLSRASVALRHAELVAGDFSECLKMAGRGDLVYCDPAYTVAHDTNGFLRYNERIFSWQDQERLASMCFEAKRRGATVFVSNACHSSVIELYSKARLHRLERKSLLCPQAANRRSFEEALFEL